MYEFSRGAPRSRLSGPARERKYDFDESAAAFSAPAELCRYVVPRAGFPGRTIVTATGNIASSLLLTTVYYEKREVGGMGHRDVVVGQRPRATAFGTPQFS